MRVSGNRVAGVLIVLAAAAVSQADVQTVVEHNGREAPSGDFKFENVPAPSRTDAATNAKITIANGRRDRNGGDVGVLRDGRGSGGQDEPGANFFFAPGTKGGRLLLDLGEITEVQKVNSYSWHSSTRGPQVYELFAADGKADGFEVEPKAEKDPVTCGWKRIAKVDTRPKEGVGGGQYGVSISDSDGTLGKFRYLLFDVSRTEDRDPFGNTFYSEIDVVDGKEHEAKTPLAPEPRREMVTAGNGKYEITIDTTETPDLSDWARDELAPLVKEWYPKLVEMMPSEGYEAPKQFAIVFSANMQGVASTGGTRVKCAANWMRQNLKGEAKGAIVHEMVHVVQQYNRARRSGRNTTRTPGWVVEGIADYVRWFLYEPESHGAEITGRRVASARYDASYRVSANFINWVSNTYDKELLKQLNTAAREARYSEDLWKEWTGRNLEELGAEWKEALAK